MRGSSTLDTGIFLLSSLLPAKLFLETLPQLLLNVYNVSTGTVAMNDSIPFPFTSHLKMPSSLCSRIFHWNVKHFKIQEWDHPQ